MGNKLIAEYSPLENKYYYYTSDQINSTRIVTDDFGTVVYAFAHDPYGGEQITWINTYNPSLKFSGKERDAESGLDYFGARYYDHSLYRFLSVDPVIPRQYALSNLQRWNLYAYCGNNPINYADPDGNTYIIFSKATQLLYIYTSDNRLYGVYSASCNPSGHLPFPNGTWSFTSWNLEGHVNDDSWDQIDSLGAIHFDFGDRTEYDNYTLHSGRDMKFDGARRWYWQHATLGCIRTERTALMALYDLHFILNDPITEIRVYDYWDPTMTEEELERLNEQAERDEWSMASYYDMMNDYFFIYGPIPPWAVQ